MILFLFLFTAPFVWGDDSVGPRLVVGDWRLETDDYPVSCFSRRGPGTRRDFEAVSLLKASLVSRRGPGAAGAD